jgi:hypothetical protein
LRRSFTPVAALLAVVYLTLAFVAYGCLFSHAASAVGEHHHHSGQPAHSNLCAWACQANSETVLPATSLQAQPFLLVLGLMFLPSLWAWAPRFDPLRPRAPPR